jgi:hypothetical protein
MLGILEGEKIGVSMEKQWMARLVNTRDSHENVHMEIVGTDEAFSNGLQYPGDPSGEAAEVINCHCYLVPKVKSVSPALEKHRAWAQDRDFMKYQEYMGMGDY